MRWTLSYARVNAYVHTARALDGCDMVWPSYLDAAEAHQRGAWERFETWQALTRDG